MDCLAISGGYLLELIGEDREELDSDDVNNVEHIRRQAGS